MEYTVKAHPEGHDLICSFSLREAFAMARTTSQFMHRPAYLYSPWSHKTYEVFGSP